MINNNDFNKISNKNSDINSSEIVKYKFLQFFPALITALIVSVLFGLILQFLGEVLCGILTIILFLVLFHYFSFLYFSSDFEKNLLELKEKIKENMIYTKKIEQYSCAINKAYNLLRNNLTMHLKYISEYIADMRTVEHDITATYLDNKPHPAHKKAQDVRELKQKTKEYITQYKQMRYEYDMLFSLFPELEDYLEYYSEENTKETIKEVKDNYDYVRSWVSKEEYEKLDENKRNQLALDRYIESRKKTKWNIGRDYEMFIGHEYENKGYTVTYTGITERLEDKGRDLIAKKGNEILVIQCKNWSKYKVIHENHICQLFGTTTQYNIENSTKTKTKPVFVTTTELSETALKFAKYLKIQIIQNKKFEEFPRIKCNIGSNGEKIYHLPFDQQYDRTIIETKKGEFFAWTVDEAVSKGFRRAKKYFYK